MAVFGYNLRRCANPCVLPQSLHTLVALAVTATQIRPAWLYQPQPLLKACRVSSPQQLPISRLQSPPGGVSDSSRRRNQTPAPESQKDSGQKRFSMRKAGSRRLGSSPPGHGHTGNSPAPSPWQAQKSEGKVTRTDSSSSLCIVCVQRECECIHALVLQGSAPLPALPESSWFLPWGELFPHPALQPGTSPCYPPITRAPGPLEP